MGNENDLYYCRICGLRQDDEELPWGPDGKCPSYEICICCGAEFGFDDCSHEAIRNYRRDWTNQGAQWDEVEEKPLNWSLEDQLKNIPERFK